MNKKEALKILNDNAATENDSYLYFIHEEGCFDEFSFWEFYNAIKVLGHEFKDEKKLSRELMKKIIKSYEWYLILIGFHFDPNDKSRIDHLPENYSQYSLRLRNAITSFIDGNPITNELEEVLNNDLKNKNESF
jgi:hypothetical protein